MTRADGTREDNKLNAKQELFCQLFASDKEFFGNGVQAYIEAYNPSQKNPNWYNAARADASRLLTKANILKRINEVMEESGLNDVHVDKQLLLLITQNADYKSKVAAIREYNKLKARITDKAEVTHILPTPILGGASVRSDDSDTTSTGLQEED